jgi:hypothetical protein
MRGCGCSLLCTHHTLQKSMTSRCMRTVMSLAGTSYECSSGWLRKRPTILSTSSSVAFLPTSLRVRFGMAGLLAGALRADGTTSPLRWECRSGCFRLVSLTLSTLRPEVDACGCATRGIATLRGSVTGSDAPSTMF